jgi:HK97 family phage major capsid protein
MSAVHNMPENNEILTRIETSLGKVTESVTSSTSKIGAIEERINRLEDKQAKPAVAAPQPIRMHGIIRGMATGRWDGFEQEEASYKDSLKRTTLNTGTGSVGGYLVPVESSNQLIDKLTAAPVLAQAGMQTIRPKGSPFTMPRATAGMTCAYVAELTGTTSASNPTFEQVSATPHQLTALCELTRLQAELGDPATATIVQNAMIRDISLKTDYTGLAGTGANTPTGLFNDGSVEATALNAVITMDVLEDALTRLEMANGITNPDKVAWIMSPRDWGTIRKLKGSTNDHYLFAVDKGARTPRSLLGYPVFLTSQIAKNFASGVANESTIALGDWSQYAHFVWGDVVFETTNTGGTSFASHSVLCKTVLWDDYKTLQPASFQLITDVR